ncbi:MAG: type I-F CRISPR-associated helicase Cas3f [Desulfomonilia bacterium]
MVIFISECEKKAINKTRQVLDAFANRIGDRTWQTIITREGLMAVRKLLRKTATKNTAVACHLIRGRNRIELVWIVGDRKRFNSQGIVPVNSTAKDVLKSQWENDWHYLPLIKSLTALAALFHDWGKATQHFQDKLKPGKAKKLIADPLRHEWVSSLLLKALVKNKSDDQWLDQLANGKIDGNIIKRNDVQNNTYPLSGLPVAASLIAWLVLSHHKLPIPSLFDIDSKHYNYCPLATYDELLDIITQQWGYENNWEENEASFSRTLAHFLDFPYGLPCQSGVWLKNAKKWSSRMKGCLPLLNQAINDGSLRLILYYSRLSLMLGDYYYSSLNADIKWNSNLPLYANTDRNTGKLKQKLDEHLIGVAKHALNTVHILPAFENELPHAHDVNSLNQKSRTSAFMWQDKAVAKIKKWREALPQMQQKKPQGVFVVNMASTGCGKTFANAKVMRALSQDGQSLRYVLALGLRTLTLQTGDEYRERVGLDSNEMAVIIGSKAVLELHQIDKQVNQAPLKQGDETASESLDALMEDVFIDYDCAVPERGLSVILSDVRSRQILYAPVLACTIDYLMAATETIRGGRYILPGLRLMSSDLVIDEIDDFDREDLVAIGRLIHLAGMLGRKVIISSATIPHSLAEGYFNAYNEGWKTYASSRSANCNVSCAWIDEFDVHVKTVRNGKDQYADYHEKFITKRIRRLKHAPVKRKAEIVLCDGSTDGDVFTAYSDRVRDAILKNHLHNNTLDPCTQKHVSFGVVRVANINPCIALTKYLASAEWPDTVDVRVMAYHSQQVLLLRHEQEKHLDNVLKRKEPDRLFNDPIIRQHIDSSFAENILFILVATPVEEVGRDHDFDWAVVEPSSYRSIIQLAGRVLRHRNISPGAPNIALMQYNIRTLRGKKPAYCWPGYETIEHPLRSHDLRCLVDEKILEERVDAIPRIQRNKAPKPHENLADLEHHSISELLTAYNEKGPESLQGWLTQGWWLTGLPQVLRPFRSKRGEKQQKLFLIPDHRGEIAFMEKDNKGRYVPSEELYNITWDSEPETAKNRLWLYRNYEEVLTDNAEMMNISLKETAYRYGEITFRYNYKQDLSQEFVYSHQFGMSKKTDS